MRNLVFNPEGVWLGLGIALVVGLLLAPLILKGFWWIVSHQVLTKLRDQGWIAPTLKYNTAFQVVFSLILVFVVFPLVLFFLAIWLIAGRVPVPGSPYAAQLLGFFVAFPLLYGAYFVLVGALWLRWLWQRLSQELWPRAVEEGAVRSRLSYATGVLIMLLILALYLLQYLIGIIAAITSRLS